MHLLSYTDTGAAGMSRRPRYDSKAKHASRRASGRPDLVLCVILILALPSSAQQAVSFGKPELVLQTGHFFDVQTVAFSPNGLWLATGSAEGTVKLWEANTGRVLRTLRGHTTEVNTAMFSHNGRWLYSSSWDGTVKVWQVSTGHLLRTLGTHPYLEHAALSPNGRLLALVYGFTVSLRDVQTGRELHAFEVHTNGVASVAFSPDGRQLASGSWDGGTTKVWAVTSGRLLRTLRGHSGRVFSVAFSPDGRSLASASQDKTVMIWDLVTGHLLHTLNHGSPVTTVAFSPNGRRLATGGWYASLKLWETSTGRELPSPSGQTQAVNAVAFSPDGLSLAAGSGNTLMLWAVDSARKLRTLSGHTGRVNDIVFSPDGRWLAIVNGHPSLAHADNAIALWDLASGQVVHTLATQSQAALHKLAFSRDARWLAAGSTDKVVHVWEVSSGREVSTLKGHTDWIWDVAFSPDGRFLASASADKTVKLWDLGTGTELRTFRVDAHVNSVAYSPDGLSLAFGSDDGSVKLWDPTTGRQLHTLEDHARDGSAVAFSPDGRWLATARGAGQDTPVKLWDVSTGRIVRTMIGQNYLVTTLAFSPNGRWLAAGTGDNLVKRWEVATGRELPALTGHEWQVAAVAFSPSGRLLASGSGDGSTRIWDSDTGALLLTLTSLSGGWLAIAPNGLFDGTAGGMQQVGWRTTSNALTVTPLDSFFNDFYHPGLLTEIVAGSRPKAEVDIATIAQVPGLRAMLARKQAHAEIRGNSLIVCFEQVPGVAVQAPIGPDSDVPTEINGYRVVPTDSTCRYRKELHSNGNARETLARLQNWNPEVVGTPWDGKFSHLRGATLHVLTVGVEKYPEGSGFDPLPYAQVSSAAVEDFFKEKEHGTKEGNAQVRVWPGLYDGEATRDAIRKRFAEMAIAMKEDDVVIVYLAGHGVIPQGQEMFYFVPVDGKDEEMRSTGLSTAMLAEALRNMPARRIVLIIDACQSGGAVEALSKIGEVKVRVEEQRMRFEANQVRTAESGVGVHIIAATLPLSYATGPKTGESPAAMTFLHALNSTRAMSVKATVNYFSNELPNASEKMLHFRQVPMTSSIGLDFPLTPE